MPKAKLLGPDEIDTAVDSALEELTWVSKALHDGDDLKIPTWKALRTATNLAAVLTRFIIQEEELDA